MARADALGRELDDVIGEFTRLTNQQLPAINRDLVRKRFAPLNVISEQDWQHTVRE